MKDFINILDLTTGEIDELIDTAADIMRHPSDYSEVCRGKTLATLFFEPSTRTRLSFEAAMYGLGGNVLGFAEGQSSSAAKGESVSDTGRIVGIYSDIIVMRHYIEGAPCAAGLASRVPVINAGDGGHFHPTQTLADLFTIKSECGRLDDLTVGICGDLKYGRTVHSLIAAMTRYKNIKFVLISPESLGLPDYVKNDILIRNGIPFAETTSLTEHMPSLDILYMTRIQKERFGDPEEGGDTGGCILNAEKLKNAKPDMKILHPLPRVGEIAVEVDSDPRARYFEQAEYGKFIRMALILRLLERRGGRDERSARTDKPCSNKRCITAAEPGLPQLVRISGDGSLRCLYCDSGIF